MRIATQVIAIRQQHPIDLQEPAHVHYSQHSYRNIHDIVAANDNDFCLHFNKLLHKV